MQHIIDLAKGYKVENYSDNRRTVIPDQKINSIIELSKSVIDLPGEVCEVGVWRGAIGIVFGEIFKNKKIYMFDTFDGISYHNEQFDNVHRKGDFGRESKHSAVDYAEFEEVKNILSIYSNISLHKGIFPVETSDIIKNERFCLVHVDVDIYQSYKDCLEFFYPKMVEGGLILLDDYAISTCEGATIAVDNFCKENNIKIHSYSSGDGLQFYLKINR